MFFLQDNDTLVIRNRIPVMVLGMVLSLNTKSDPVNSKEFRVLKDGEVLTDYMDVNEINILSILNTYDGNEELVCYLRYKEKHNFMERLNLEKESVLIRKFGFFNTQEEFSLSKLNWIENILEKSITKGGDVVPNFVNNRTLDGVTFWFSIIKYFSYYKEWGDYLAKLDGGDLLREFLQQRDVLLGDSTTIDKLKSIQNDYFKEFSKRGTIKIFEEDDSLLRLLNTNKLEFGLVSEKNRGWNLSNFSPLNRTLITDNSFCKFGDYTIFEGGENKHVREGYSFVSHANNLVLKPINPLKVFAQNSYSLSFDLEVESNNSSLTIRTEELLKSRRTGADTRAILSLNSLPNGTSLRIVVNFYNYRSMATTFDTLNIKQGVNLIFKTKDQEEVTPIIEFTGKCSISNLSFTPLMTEEPRGFNFSKYLIVWSFNRSNSENKELENIIRQKLLPYDMDLLLIDLDKSQIVNKEESILPDPPRFYWVGDEFSCLYEEFTEEVDNSIFTDEYQEEFE